MTSGVARGDAPPPLPPVTPELVKSFQQNIRSQIPDVPYTMTPDEMTAADRYGGTASNEERASQPGSQFMECEIRLRQLGYDHVSLENVCSGLSIHAPTKEQQAAFEAKNPPKPVDPNAWAWFAESAVKNRLKDPDSANFNDVHIYPGASADDRWVCGAVNAKNGFGGYAGFMPFVAHITVINRDPPNGGLQASTAAYFPASAAEIRAASEAIAATPGFTGTSQQLAQLTIDAGNVATVLGISLPAAAKLTSTAMSICSRRSLNWQRCRPP